MSTTFGDSSWDRSSIAIAELIGTRVMDCLPRFGQWFDDMTTIDIGKADSGFQLGRDGLVKKRFQGSLAGVVRGGNVYNHRAIYGDKTAAIANAPFYLNAAQTVGPDPATSAVPTPWGLTMQMYSFEATVPMTLGQQQLEVTPANIQDQIAPVFSGFAANMAQFVSCGFFLDRELDCRLGTLGSSSGTRAWSIDTTNKTLTFFPLERAMQRFVPGQEVDLYDGSTSATTLADTRINETGGARIAAWISAVNHATGKVTVQFDPNVAATSSAINGITIQDNTTETSTSLSIGDYIVPADQNTGAGLKSAYSWLDWTKAGGTGNAKKRLLGSAAVTTTANDYIDVEVRPHAASYQIESIGTLTQQDLELYLDEGMLALQAYGHDVDMGVMSRGVRHAMWQLDLARSYQVNVRPASQDNYGLKGGFAVTTPSGGTVNFYVSNMIQDGEMVVLKWKNNWKIMTQPSPAGAGSNSQLSPKEGPARSIPVLFKGKLFGYPTDKVPVLTANAQHLDEVHYPCMARYNFVPTAQLAGIRLSGVTTSRAYSSPS